MTRPPRRHQRSPARCVLGEKPARKRKLLAGGLGVVVLAVLLVFGIPWVVAMFNTVSTDDAYVNGHVTFVGRSRMVAGDKFPVCWSMGTTTVCARRSYRRVGHRNRKIAVSEKQAAVDTARMQVYGGQPLRQ